MYVGMESVTRSASRVHLSRPSYSSVALAWTVGKPSKTAKLETGTTFRSNKKQTNDKYEGWAEGGHWLAYGGLILAQ